MLFQIGLLLTVEIVVLMVHEVRQARSRFRNDSTYIYMNTQCGCCDMLQDSYLVGMNMWSFVS